MVVSFSMLYSTQQRLRFQFYTGALNISAAKRRSWRMVKAGGVYAEETD
jgi:hypothetical protein